MAEVYEGSDITGGPCPECLKGVLYLKHLTYFTWLQDELVTVPNFPAWVCDLCGHREDDPRAIRWLNTLLQSETRRPSPRPRPRPSDTGSLQP